MRKDKDTLERAQRAAKSPPLEDFWKVVKLIKLKKKKKADKKRV